MWLSCEPAHQHSPKQIITKLLCVRKQHLKRCFNLCSCCFKWRNYLNHLQSFFLWQIFTLFYGIFSPTFFFRDVSIFSASSPRFNFLLFDPSPLVSSPSSFTAWRRSWHPGRHVKPWRTGGNKRENSSNLQESSPFTLTPVVLCPLIQPWR